MLPKFNGYVYFVHAPSLNLVKIGYSRTNPEKRFRGFLIGSPVELERLGVAPARGTRTEVEFHRRFAPLRVRGEWFRAEGDLAEFLAAGLEPWPPEPSRVQMPLEFVDDVPTGKRGRPPARSIPEERMKRVRVAEMLLLNGLTVGEVARRAGMSKRSIRGWAYQALRFEEGKHLRPFVHLGKLPGEKCGRKPKRV